AEPQVPQTTRGDRYMRSGWPHSEDGRGMTPASQGHVPFGPEVSWPTGFSALEHPGGNNRYPATRAEQSPVASHGAHPYAAFGGSGYGDDGYRPWLPGAGRPGRGHRGHQDGSRVRRVRPEPA